MIKLLIVEVASFRQVVEVFVPYQLRKFITALLTNDVVIGLKITLRHIICRVVATPIKVFVGNALPFEDEVPKQEADHDEFCDELGVAMEWIRIKKSSKNGENRTERERGAR